MCLKSSDTETRACSVFEHSHAEAHSVFESSAVRCPTRQVHEDDAASLQQLQFRTVGDTLLDAGFDPARLALAPYFGHAGPTDEPLYFGAVVGTLA